MSRVGSGYGDGPGVDSEELVKELLQKSGWAVKELRKAADGGRAPMLENEIDSSLRVVDFQAHNQKRKTRYVEVKSKQEPREFGIEEELRHGWEKPQHLDYQDFATEYTDDPVYIFVHERSTGVILRQRVRKLTPVQEITDESKLQIFNTNHPMLMFRRDDFRTVTNDVSQYETGFGQSGLVKDDIDLDPFGDDPDGQTGLADFGGGGDE